jgi:hypothetical protein
VKLSSSFFNSKNLLMCITKCTCTNYVHQTLANLHHVLKHHRCHLQGAYALAIKRHHNGPLHEWIKPKLRICILVHLYKSYLFWLEAHSTRRREHIKDNTRTRSIFGVACDSAWTLMFSEGCRAPLPLPRARRNISSSVLKFVFWIVICLIWI